VKNIKLSFEIKHDEESGFIVEYADGGFRTATITEILLWNILWEMRAGVNVNS
jgi:hypothetical protein